MRLAPKNRRLTCVWSSQTALSVIPTFHHLLFIALPLALVATAVTRRGGDERTRAFGALRFSAAVAKLVFLVLPLWQLGALVARGGPHNLSTSISVAVLLALPMCLGFALSALTDAVGGLGLLLGFSWRITALERPAPLWRTTLVAVVLGLAALFALCGSFGHGVAVLKALVSPPQTTIAIWFQEARVWSNFHFLTLAAALLTFFGVPRTMDVLQGPWRPWKAIVCLGGFAAAAAVLWTRYTYLS